MSPLPPEVAALVEESKGSLHSYLVCNCPTCRLCRALLASPPAPVEDDGLDERVDYLDRQSTIGLNSAEADDRRWLRELQARRRGER